VADHPHDVGLMSLFVEGVAHGFTVDGEAFIGLAIGCIPTLQGAIESLGVDADEAIPEDGFARHLISAVDPPAAMPKTAGSEWRRPWARRGSGMSLKKRGNDWIWSAVNMIFGAPVR
jgi:hypothetical protein